MRTITDLTTPCLITDLPAMNRNIQRMADYFSSRTCKLRPHFKAHKTSEVAKRQLAAGSCTGLTCATVHEAEAALRVCDDLLIANEIVGRSACDRVAALARKATVTVAVDSDRGLRDISEAASRSGVTIGALVDINVGQNRCGVSSPDEALTLARRILETPSLRLRGVMGYEGHAVGIASRTEREAEVRRSMSKLVEAARVLKANGVPVEIVSGGGTGSYDIDSEIDGITEIQAGSYAMMDTAYAALGLPFEFASYVMGTIISRPVPDRCVADCGHKSCTKDHGNPGVKGLAGATVTALNDEHAIIALPPNSPVGIGDRVFLIPSHTDPTLNLHDVMYVVDGEQVVDEWKVDGRGWTE